MQRSRALIISFGHHARRIYFPAIQDMHDVELAGIVDLESQKDHIDEFLKNNGTDLPTLCIQGGEGYSRLTQFASKLRVNAVIISTDPESHVAYAKWAFSNGLHVMMDKPVHAEPAAAHNVRAAKKIHSEYLELRSNLLEARRQYPGLLCEVLSQRRYHPVFEMVQKTVNEAYQKTGCPITYFYAFHSDGQFRFPEEIRDMEYHGFKRGFGKASHSGYHFFDVLNWLSGTYREDFSINRISCSAWANFPDNYLKQVRPESLKKPFPDYKPATASLKADYGNYGELDVMSRLQLKSDEDVITHAQIDLLHSGFSARSWSQIGDRDIYKGNGRIRHEQYYIDMGPYLAVSLTSWQAIKFNKETMDTDFIFKPGHEFNVDLNIFKNKVLGAKKVESYKLDDLYIPSLHDYSRGHQEDARRNGIREFFDLIVAGVSNGSSSLLSHSLSSQMMSTVYESVAQKAEITNTLSG